ncbi:hypothetical protein FKM82_010928 [Ascaphus truei]
MFGVVFVLGGLPCVWVGVWRGWSALWCCCICVCVVSGGVALPRFLLCGVSCVVVGLRVVFWWLRVVCSVGGGWGRCPRVDVMGCTCVVGVSCDGVFVTVCCVCACFSCAVLLCGCVLCVCGCRVCAVGVLRCVSWRGLASCDWLALCVWHLALCGCCGGLRVGVCVWVVPCVWGGCVCVVGLCCVWVGWALMVVCGLLVVSCVWFACVCVWCASVVCVCVCVGVECVCGGLCVCGVECVGLSMCGVECVWG